MADNKKYYYMRLKENFFDTDELKILESMDDGYLYSNILIKLYLKSLKYEGRLLFKDTIPYNSKMIATITNHHIGVVEKALVTFHDLGLITLLDGNVMYMNEIELLVGKTSTEGDRKRAVRKQIENGEFKGLIETKKEDGQMSDKCPPENRVRDKSLELEFKDKENIKDNVTSVPLPVSKEEDKYPYKEVIDYLNGSANKGFKYVASHKKHIVARFKEGFTLEEFKKVIEVKTHQWLNDPKNNIYLRPETLFGNKMDGYLQEYYKPNNEQKKYQQPTQQVTSKEFNYDGAEDWSNPKFD